MFKPTVLLSFVFAALVAGQQAGTYQTETHPRMSFQECTAKNSCRTINGEVVLDANWRWAHIVGDYKNCYTDNAWDTSICSSPSTCAQKCAIEGVDYSGTYGITTSGNQLNIKFVTKHQYGTNVGGRVYMMENSTKYYMFKLLNKEFTFDVDVSQLGCGFNGALYFVSMPQDGGMKGNNKAGAKYGTGYCDAQCPHDMKWIEGEANTLEWQPSEDDKNAGRGAYGTCCDEMDIWEANSMSTAFTPHTCSKHGACKSASECGDNGPTRYDGVCDKDGCDFNSYRLGVTDFYGKGKTVDTTKKMTVVTQFLTNTGTDSGELSEIRRIYVQNGQVIQNSRTNIAGMGDHDSITMDFCDDAKRVFNDNPHYQTLGGHRKMGQELKNGMVLAMSIWGDFYARMLWLDSAYPLDRDPSEPGITRGECPQDGGDPNDLVANFPNTTVRFSNIKFGAIDSTY